MKQSGSSSKLKLKLEGGYGVEERWLEGYELGQYVGGGKSGRCVKRDLMKSGEMKEKRAHKEKLDI